MKDFSGRASRTELDRWWQAIETGRMSDEVPSLRASSDSLPPPRSWSDRNPEADVRLKFARNLIAELSTDLLIPVENLLTPETLRRVAWNPPEPVTGEAVAAALVELGARPWQIESTAQLIAQAFVEASQSIENARESNS